MDSIRILAFLGALVVSCNGDADPILTSHLALPHNLPVDPIGFQKFPVAPFHLSAAPAVTVKHLGSVAHHAPLTVAHHAPVSVAHHAPVAVAHHAPVAFAHHAPVSVKHVTSKVAVAAPLPVAHVAHAKVVAPAVKVAHHVPAVAVAHPSPVSQSQYHAQDELGQYAFGYSDINSARDETRDAYGNVRGSFSYVDSYGKLQTQHYVADDYGFRVTGTNLPVDHGHRLKRSYGTYPASTGPLATTVVHAAPVLHAPFVHKVAAPYVHHVAAPIVHKVAAPVVHKIAAPIVHKVAAPVIQHVAAPVIQHVAAPVVHKVAAPVVPAAPFALGYAGVPQYGYAFHSGPSVTSYNSYH